MAIVSLLFNFIILILYWTFFLIAIWLSKAFPDKAESYAYDLGDYLWEWTSIYVGDTIPTFVTSAYFSIVPRLK